MNKNKKVKCETSSLSPDLNPMEACKEIKTFNSIHLNQDDDGVVAITNEMGFFCSEPGAGIIGLGLALEPENWKDLIRWMATLGTGVYLSESKQQSLKYLSLLLAFASLRPFGDGKYIRFMFGMATVMRVLRVVEINLDPTFFEKRGKMYTIKFAFLYHDIRRASCFKSKQERQDSIAQAWSDIALYGSGFGLILLACARLVPNPLPTSLKSTYVVSVLSMLRFFCFIRTVEAGYRLHLAWYNIRAPLCFDAPWNALTVNEFWAVRWNLSIAQQLRNVFYKPLAIRGMKTLASLSVFLGSAVLHMIPIVSLGGNAKMIRHTALFFLLQPVLIALERTFPRILHGRWWVQLALWGVSPLFAIPMYTVF